MDSHNAGCPPPSYHETKGLCNRQFFSFTRFHKNLQEFTKICLRCFKNLGVDFRRGGRPVFCYPRPVERMRGFMKRPRGCVGATIHPSPKGPPGFPLPPGLLQGEV